MAAGSPARNTQGHLTRDGHHAALPGLLPTLEQPNMQGGGTASSLTSLPHPASPRLPGPDTQSNENRKNTEYVLQENRCQLRGGKAIPLHGGSSPRRLLRTARRVQFQRLPPAHQQVQAGEGAEDHVQGARQHAEKAEDRTGRDGGDGEGEELRRERRRENHQGDSHHMEHEGLLQAPADDRAGQAVRGGVQAVDRNAQQRGMRPGAGERRLHVVPGTVALPQPVQPVAEGVLPGPTDGDD